MIFQNKDVLAKIGYMHIYYAKSNLSVLLSDYNIEIEFQNIINYFYINKIR